MARLTQGTPRAERSDALANRQRILEAAREVFARRGLEAEVKEIAERAGVGIGTLYRHFESREGLLAALVHQAGEDLLRRMQPVLGAGEPRVAIRAMIHAAAGLFEQFGALTEVILARKMTGELDEFHPGGHDEFHADYPDLYNDIVEVMADVLRRGMREGMFRADLDVPVAVAALESIFTSGMLLALAARRSYPAAADAVADFFLNAIEAPKRESS
ncbi:MAG TPA: TetR family transcriptional regulator [Dehalococcoidia bacterium]|nr:TetR family transcriptional regulator [Dehalococcoidia bacterium]